MFIEGYIYFDYGGWNHLSYILGLRVFDLKALLAEDSWRDRRVKNCRLVGEGLN